MPGERWRRILALGAGLGFTVACGGSSQSTSSDGPATAAQPIVYPVTRCHVGAPIAQTLWILEPGGEPRPLITLPDSPPDLLDLCGLYAFGLTGVAAKPASFLQRFGLSPDGRTIVLEITDDFALALLGWQGFLDPSQEGIFVLGSDGSGRRRLGPASRIASFEFQFDTSAPQGFLGDFSGGTGFAFSPDGRTVAFTDLGAAPSGEESVQIFVLDLSDGTRRQVTHLPPFMAASGVLEISGVTFFDAETVGFAMRSGEALTINLVNVATGALVIREPPAAVPGASFAPTFSINARNQRLFELALADVVAENPVFGRDLVTEIFIERGPDVLQLTNFQRIDTGPGFLVDRGRRVLFVASTNRLGTNPTNNCQFFSVDALGGDLRQLTAFDTGETAEFGCTGSLRPGCLVLAVAYEPAGEIVLFESTCDPFGTNPAGPQFFAIRSDGSGLRQLTFAAGVIAVPAGTVSVEFPGPFAHPPPLLGG
jgi:hypothetical protein